MIAIVVAFQFGVCLFQSDIQSLGIFLYARAENSVEFFLGDTTKPRILVEHGNLLQVVQFGEDAHLGELCYTRDEDELQIRLLLAEGRDIPDDLLERLKEKNKTTPSDNNE